MNATSCHWCPKLDIRVLKRSSNLRLDRTCEYLFITFLYFLYEISNSTTNYLLVIVCCYSFRSNSAWKISGQQSPDHKILLYRKLKTISSSATYRRFQLSLIKLDNKSFNKYCTYVPTLFQLSCTQGRRRRRNEGTWTPTRHVRPSRRLTLRTLGTRYLRFGPCRMIRMSSRNAKLNGNTCSTWAQETSTCTSAAHVSAISWNQVITAHNYAVNVQFKSVQLRTGHTFPKKKLEQTGSNCSVNGSSIVSFRFSMNSWMRRVDSLWKRSSNTMCQPMSSESPPRPTDSSSEFFWAASAIANGECWLFKRPKICHSIERQTFAFTFSSNFRAFAQLANLYLYVVVATPECLQLAHHIARKTCACGIRSNKNWN